MRILGLQTRILSVLFALCVNPAAALGSPTPDPPAASGVVREAWSDLLPALTDFCHAVVDEDRDRVVTFDGSGELWSCPLTGEPRWQKLSPSGTGPIPGIRIMGVVDDTTHHRALVVAPSGISPTTLRVWSLALSDPPVWSEIMTAGEAPEVWWHPAVMMDPVRRRLLVVGGFDGFSYRNDVWTLSLEGTPAWSRLVVEGARPASRAFSTASFDERRDQLILHGGRNNFFEYGLRDTWALSLSESPAWRLIDDGTQLPSGNIMHGAHYDPDHDRLIVLFGLAGRGSRSDVWALPLETHQWFQMAFADTIPGRYAQASCLDARRGRILVYGGRSRDLDFPYLADLWTVDLANPSAWQEVSAVPVPRSNGAVALDPVQRKMFMFGGKTSAGLVNDLWSVGVDQETAWKRVIASGAPPSPRCGHTLLLDPSEHRLILFGGADAQGAKDDLWELRLDNDRPLWRQLALKGVSPSPRSGHVATMDVRRGRMLVFGGKRGEELFDDTWSLDLRTDRGWSQLPAAAGPSARVHAAGVFDEDQNALVIMGGLDADSLRDDTWRLDLTPSPAWRLVDEGEPRASGGGRARHVAVLDASARRVVVYGGEGSRGPLNDTRFLRLDAGGWYPLATDGLRPDAPIGNRRPTMTAVLDEATRRMLLVGEGRYNGTALLELRLGAPTSRPRGYLVQSRADLQSVHLEWAVGGVPPSLIRVERGDATGSWRAVAEPSTDASGRIVVDDTHVQPGARYGYRLVAPEGIADGTQVLSAETWLRIPDAPQLGLSMLGANPSFGALEVSLDLPGRGAATLEVVDVSGRIRLSRAVGALGPGHHRLELAGTERLRPGLYFVRLRTSEGSICHRRTILR